MRTKSKSKPNNNSIQELAFEEEIEENGLCEFPVTGTPVAQFSFTDNSILKDEPMIKTIQPEIKKPEVLSSDLITPFEFTDKKALEPNKNRTSASYPYGITPPVNGEYFDTRHTKLLKYPWRGGDT